MNPIENEAQLETWLSEPTPEVVETLARLPGDIVLLGVAGKMGPTLARMAKRASDAAGVRRRVIGVARFSDGGQAELEAHGVETVRCDLLNEDDVARLPDAANVIFMTGRKFGSTGDEPLTWAMNAYLPAVACRKYRRSRIVAFSTGNVYGLTPPARGGSRESDALEPAGEYAMSSVGRERMFAYFSRSLNIPLAIVRLNYACELRYGVLVDLAQRVARGEPIELSMGHFNVIWQGDANAMALRCLRHCATPTEPLNVTGPETVSVRGLAHAFAERFGTEATVVGEEAPTALLSDASRALALFGPPTVGLETLVAWQADWLARGMPTLAKPTGFERRDGSY